MIPEVRLASWSFQFPGPDLRTAGREVRIPGPVIHIPDRVTDIPGPVTYIPGQLIHTPGPEAQFGTRVFDPACGSGNFLYVSLDSFKRLESGGGVRGAGCR